MRLDPIRPDPHSVGIDQYVDRPSPASLRRRHQSPLDPVPHVGASVWFPDGGLSSQPAALDRLDRTLAAIARTHTVRIFLFATRGPVSCSTAKAFRPESTTGFCPTWTRSWQPPDGITLA